MGVPGLYWFIRNNFGRKALKNFQRGEKRFHFNYVYLDANGLLHAAAQKVFNYGEGKRKLDPYLNMTVEEKYTQVFKLFFDNILDVTEMVVPTTVLYITIDGPAPRAKQNQQRERRFIAAQSRLEEEKTAGVSRFDSNSITPGTLFMHRLSQFMYFKIRHYMQTRGAWHNIKIIYSPPTVPGEGEHKIMDYIRSLPTRERDFASHCMFGPDGDLLMLTLSAHVNQMSLFREDQRMQGTYNLINMSKVRKELSRALGQWNIVQMGQRTEDDVSNDFILIGFFVGNDFLPKVKMFFRLDEGLQKMIDTYVETSDGGIRNHLTDGTHIMIKGFRKFVYHLAKYEEQYLAAQAIVTARDARFIDHTLLKHASVGTTNVGIKAVMSIDMKGYRRDYYNKAGVVGENTNPEFEAGVRSMCREYFRNLVWVYLYYTDALPSWEQSYKYHYAPLLSDFAAYLDTLDQSDLEEKLTFSKSIAACPFEQLLSVLPPASKDLLPSEYQTLMTDSDSPLVKAGYYPTTFKIDREGKRKEHEGIAILPYVDYNVISNVFHHRQRQTKLRYHRNQLGGVYAFRWIRSGFRVNFRSRYGTIDNCTVRVTSVE